MTHDEMIQVIRDHQAGHVIQRRFVGDKANWQDDPNPIWNFVDLEYRRKPEPRKPREIWVNEYAQHMSVHFSSACDADMRALPNRIRCVKFVEVVED